MFSWDQIRDDASFEDFSFLLRASSDRGLRGSPGLHAYGTLSPLREGRSYDWRTDTCMERKLGDQR